MRKIVVVIPHSHTWFWTQTCLASLIRNPPEAEGFEVEVVVVDNSPWSPAVYGVELFEDLWQLPDEPILCTVENPKSNKFHASALDFIVDTFEFDLLMAFETDVLALRPNWLQWFVDQLRPTDFAVGHWHHEKFINPSCTLYRGDVLKAMSEWCETLGEELRWGDGFTQTAPLDNNLPLTENPASALENILSWVSGPFAEKRGWPAGTVLREAPSGQLKGPGWYEPGQQLHHWAVEQGYTYTVCPTMTTQTHLPLQTLYGSTMPDPRRQLEAVELFGNAETAHMWGGTRALDILKHPVTCEFVKSNTPMWLAREARFWRSVVPESIQRKTLDLIREHGWHITGQGSDHVSDRDREAADYVRRCYAQGGVTW